MSIAGRAPLGSASDLPSLRPGPHAPSTSTQPCFFASDRPVAADFAATVLPVIADPVTAFAVRLRTVLTRAGVAAVARRGRGVGVGVDSGGWPPPYRCRAASPDVPTTAPMARHEYPAARIAAAAFATSASARALACTAVRACNSGAGSRPAPGSGSMASNAADSSSAWSTISCSVLGILVTFSSSGRSSAV